jgi:hypothetical protein
VEKNMLRRLIVTGALLAVFTAPSLAADWYVLKSESAPETAENMCMVVDRMAVAGEVKVAGPFASEEEGTADSKENLECKGKEQNQNMK